MKSKPTTTGFPEPGAFFADGGSFERFLRHYGPLLEDSVEDFRVRAAALGYPLEDLRQEARIALWEAIQTYPARPGDQFYYWARIKLRFALRGCLRSFERCVKRGRPASPLPVALTADWPSPHSVYEEALWAGLIDPILSRLPLEWQEVALWFCEGASFAEVRKRARLPAGEVRIIRQLLRTYLVYAGLAPEDYCLSAPLKERDHDGHDPDNGLAAAAGRTG